MKKRIFIIHGWDGYPEEGWFPWLKKELEAQGYEANILKMPHPSHPKIQEWVAFLSESVKNSDEKTYFVGHSIGCQTVLRYLQSLTALTKIGGVVMVAGWIRLHPAATNTAETWDVAEPWLMTAIDWSAVKSHTNNFTTILSDNDAWVYQEDGEIFKNKLGAKIIIEHSKGHFSGEDGINELPVALQELLLFP